ncbi:helix-turn-helix transcriptional regulator [Ornithinimicrobium sp. INDO-MA30-4]|nr:helix-turn-helix transcriptional regulator [Ornithinimicrobium sp. INDO-MA30-4]UJH70210.1 helix-turn-helix transcriptional regulator [Ornithinimicrobium sp. INDO-MA30-4]
MAKILGITRQTVISIENNHFDPRLSLAFRVAEHFDVPVDEVFYSADDGE